MTGYGRGEVDHGGVKFSVELNSVNRKQSDIVINLPRELAALEPRIRQAINEKFSRGRTNVIVTSERGANGTRKLALDTALAHSYHDAMRALQKELNAPGRNYHRHDSASARRDAFFRKQDSTRKRAGPQSTSALQGALAELIKMREREGKHLAKDLIHRLKIIRAEIKRFARCFRKW